ncbi:MAG TPA: 23S rRNA (adenine(2030)-N(6))-methyltransferase RlmJ [Paracoccaceae bacterium]|nr:23S rRNA (adenine(2030)-N(6))-methyltransferase RlmJ [Paracoccaceae bacterium]HMO73451.1 23S rRNA (adenine(2030)-N(6))-methyltransferase RlmJ [Paracoccaceae bacterium]
MLSYQHAYHAGNAADVHKHAALAWVLDYLAQKDKPLTYLETHAGRAVYDLAGPEAAKTGEAAAGILALEGRIDPGHPFRRTLERLRTLHGASAYPGSPLIAALMLRPGDRMHLCELHPAEAAALRSSMAPHGAHVLQAEGMATALSLMPPTPRRGLCLIDPSWEVKDDYAAVPRTMQAMARKWNVGILMLWYPLLRSELHLPMLEALAAAFPAGLRHEIRFPPARAGHGMRGSGLFVVNPPWGLDAALAAIAGAITGKD